MMRSVYGDHKRFYETYFSMFKGYYFTGDGARRDEDGDYWITGRVDDVLNISGHRLGTAEIESGLVLHPKVAEAAVVGYPHDITGQGIYAYVTLMAGETGTDELKTDLITLVRSEIGPIAKVNIIQWAPGLPKTRSGKIMRRILRKISVNEIDQLGDTSTLAEMTKEEIINLTKTYDTETNFKKISGIEQISIFTDRIHSNSEAIGWKHAIFLISAESKWRIGFSLDAQTIELDGNKLKSVLVKWLNNPSNEILKEFTNL